MATDNRPRKRSRPGVQFQMEFHFEDNGSKQDRVESMKRKLAPGKALDNREFMLTLLEIVEKAESRDSSIQEPTTSATVDDPQSCSVKSSMLDSSGM